MRPVSLSGTADERFSQVEKILTRIIGQIPQVITCQIPPVPLSFYAAEVPEDGVVLRYIFPVGGILKRAAILIDDMGEHKNISFQATARNDKHMAAQNFSTAKRSNLLKLELPLEAGMAVTVKCEQPVKGIWIGLLFQVRADHAETMQMALAQTDDVHARIHSEI